LISLETKQKNNIHSPHLHHVKKGLCYKVVVKTEESGPLNLLFFSL
jgi:hypothetical protein